MLKIGLEREGWLLKDGEVVIVPNGYRADSCGLMVEYTGEPSMYPYTIVYNLLASEAKLLDNARTDGYTIDYTPVRQLSREIRIEASRKYTKGLTKYQNLYGYVAHRTKQSELTVGLHISFTNPRSLCVDGKMYPYNAMWDYIQVFKFLDTLFKDEIKAANRNPGFYELKCDGRIEYRSLPASVDVRSLIPVLDKIQKEF